MPTTNFINTHPGWSITYFFMIRARAATFTDAHCGMNLLCRDHATLCEWMKGTFCISRHIIKWVTTYVWARARSRKGADCVHQGMTHIVLLSSLVLLFTAHEMPLCFELAKKTMSHESLLSVCAFRKIDQSSPRDETTHTQIFGLVFCNRIAHARRDILH